MWHKDITNILVSKITMLKSFVYSIDIQNVVAYATNKV